MRYEAEDIMSLELSSEAGGQLPPFTAGAHIDLRLPNGLIRSYSLIGPESDLTTYRIAVSRDPTSRGGSAFIHDQLRAGDQLSFAGPRNNFPLAENASAHAFFAGGIGITPFLSMVRR